MENSGNGNSNDLLAMFNNLKLEFNNEIIIINNENDLLNYIGQIDQLAIIFDQKYKSKYLNNENIDKRDQKKFIPLFSKKDKFYESFNSNIKNTFNSSKNQKPNYNNVFILNNILEENQEFCYEIKLGQGWWDNIINLKDSNNLIIGLLELNKDNIKEISEYISISPKKQIETTDNFKNFEGVNLFSDNSGKNKKFEEYKKAIYFNINMNNYKVPIFKDSGNNNGKDRLIQKNDIIGIVYNNKTFKDFIEMKIFINGELITTELIIKPKIVLGEENDSDYDDEFELEKKSKNFKKNQILVPFIEIGDNKSIFIKDKSIKNGEIRNTIIYNENIDYIDKYQSSPLNYFPEEIFDLQNITKAYFEILIKIGSKIFKYKKNDINQYFNQLIYFFKNYSFNNRLVAENCLLDFLLRGIDIDKGNISQFKENLETLLNIINAIGISNDLKKIDLLEKIISFLIELIMENNSNLFNYYKLEQYKNNEIENFRKNKFILCFLLFDNYFIQGDQIVTTLLSKVGYLKNENNIFNFCYSVFSSNYYFDSAYAEEYIKQFYINNEFNKMQFLNYGFRKFIEDKYYNKIFEDNQFMMKIILKEIDIKKKEKTSYLIKFITGFCSSEDNVSIINFIIIQLIKLYFQNPHNIDKSKVEKIIFTNYITMNLYNFNLKENTFYGKNDKIQNKLILTDLQMTDPEKKEALIFEIIVKCISNYYQVFALKEKNANNILEQISNQKNNLADLEIYKINSMIEFYQSIYFGNFFLHLGYFTNYLLKFLLICIKEKYLEVVPYYSYLQNILFILDMFKIRCTFIEKNNLVDKNELSIIFSNIDKILKFSISFLGEVVPKIRKTNFNPSDDFEELISLNIQILIKSLSFDIHLIQNSFSSVKDNLVLAFKNLAELYDKDNYKILYTNINKLVEFLYDSDSDQKDIIQVKTRNEFFKGVMANEMEEFKKKVKEDNTVKNNYIEHTMYYNIFIIIYKRIKIIRGSLLKIFENNLLFESNIFYQKKYLIKFTKLLKIFYNFLMDNSLDMYYDISSTLFLKINSFICKTFKMLQNESVFKKIQNIYEEDKNIFDNFYTTFLFLISYLLIPKSQDGTEYYTQMAQNRKGFYFDIFKINFEKYFGYPECKTMIEFLDILLEKFRGLCKDEDCIKLEEVNDNSIDLDKRDSCPICLEYTNENDVHINPCNHVIHKKCLEDLISKSNKKQCPLCKRIIIGIKEDPTFVVSSSSNSSNLFSNERGNLFGSNNLFLFSNNSRPSNNNEINRPQNSLFGRQNATSLFSADNNLNINLNPGGGLFGQINNNNNHGNLFGNSLFG